MPVNFFRVCFGSTANISPVNSSPADLIFPVNRFRQYVVLKFSIEARKIALTKQTLCTGSLPYFGVRRQCAFTVATYMPTVIRNSRMYSFASNRLVFLQNCSSRPLRWPGLVVSMFQVQSVTCQMFAGAERSHSSWKTACIFAKWGLPYHFAT